MSRLFQKWTLCISVAFCYYQFILLEKSKLFKILGKSFKSLREKDKMTLFKCKKAN